MKATSRSTLLVLTRVIPRKAARLPALLMALALLICLAAFAAGAYAQTTTFTAQELLGKPTDTSVTISIVPASNIQYRYEYGTASGSYPHGTTPVNATGGQPSEVTIQGLSPHTLYYYRMVYDADGSVTDGTFETRTEHTFRTQRTTGGSFAFTVTSDSHGAGTNVANAMTNILNEQPDLHIDLGDTFMIDNTSSQSAVDTAYLAYRKPNYFDKIGSSIPIFLASGNHENEEGWNFDDTPFSIALASVKARKLYYPTPIDNGFYSGNTDPLAALDAATYGDQYREDYYAWTWGDSLFVVIDEFQYTMNLPYSPAAGEGSESVTGDQWSWTLGQQQYDWLTQTLENSHAKYKFVFSHNMLGGVPRDLQGVGAGYVRGGAEAAGYFEWGGKNANGTEGFAAHRPGWDKTIQQLFVENGVSAYFHGHDHQYVYEKRGGVVYQEVPSAGTMGAFGGVYTEGDHGDYNTINQITANGHLRITVGQEQATVDLILSNSTTGAVNYSYDIAPNVSDDPNIDVTGSLSAFSSQPGTPSPQQSYTVSGSNLTAGILITAPVDFQISTTSGSGWTSSLTLPQTGGTVSSTPIYVRFDRATEGTSSGNIVHSSAGATTQNQAVTGTATLPISAISVTAPTGTTTKAQGAAQPVSWTPNTAVASGQFSIWVVSPANGWYGGKIVSATGAASYSDSVDLNVPVDTGYRIFVYYRATSGDPWGIYGMSPGTVNVTAGLNAISVTAPTGTGSQAQGSSLPVTWTTNTTVASGQFSIWVVSPGNGWYVGKIHAADGTASYSDSVDLNVPVDSGYRVYVYYRATSGDPWGIYGMSPGTVDVTAAGFNAISVTAPTGTSSRTQGSALPVTWTTNSSVASGQFSIWVVSPANSWYVGKIHAADGTASYSDSVDLNVPVDTGYRVFVYYRATSGDPWGIYGYSSARST